MSMELVVTWVVMAILTAVLIWTVYKVGKCWRQIWRLDDEDDVAMKHISMINTYLSKKFGFTWIGDEIIEQGKPYGDNPHEGL